MKQNPNSNLTGSFKNRELSLDHEIEQYVESFTVSSDRVRRLLIVSLVASVLAFVAYRNTLPSNWLDARTTKARIAFRNKLWNDPQHRLETCKKEGPIAAGFIDPCDMIEENVGWVLARQHSATSLKAHLETLEHLRVERNLLVNVPWLGINFDINDLGAFSAISLALLFLTLCFAMARKHENLYLCLWKVRRIADRETRYNDGESEANFLYHALVMAQVFTQPPTLARWYPSRIGRIASRTLLFVPLGVQLLITASNFLSIKVATAINPRAAIFSMSVQTLFLLPLGICTLICCVYSRAIDGRWRETFFTINPHLRSCTRASSLDWLRIGKQPSWEFSSDSRGNLYVGRPFDSANPFDATKPWNGWKLSSDGKNLERIENYSDLPESLRTVTDDDGNEYRFQPSAEDRAISVLVQIDVQGDIRPLAGGQKDILDGTGTQAGFRRVRTLLLDAERSCLYAIDGACLRRIDLKSGKVESLGGNPLGGQPRSLWPRLLGLHLDGDRLLIADYDYGCVRSLCRDGSDPQKIWQSRGLWSPAGVAADGEFIYVLEHRALNLIGSLLGYVGTWARVWSFPRYNPNDGRPADARLLLRISGNRAMLEST